MAKKELKKPEKEEKIDLEDIPQDVVNMFMVKDELFVELSNGKFYSIGLIKGQIDGLRDNIKGALKGIS